MEIRIFSAYYDIKIDSIGALDNASGVCSLMEASRLTSLEDLDYNLRVIFFSSGEYFMFDSRSYINNLSEGELNNIIGCFNIDMVGNKKANHLIFDSHKGEDNILTTEFKRIFKDIPVKNYFGENSDELSFRKKGISSFRFTTADYQSKEYDERLLAIETDIESLSLDELSNTASIIYNYMKDLEVENIIIGQQIK